MITLALDTSANLCAAALHDGERIIAAKSEDIGRGHAERLMGLLQEVLDSAALAYGDIDRIAVTTGPGSFTGIRVGIAAAQGLALGLNIPVTGISVLEAIAFQHRKDHQDCPLIVAMDARRGEIFLQKFDGGNASEPLNVPLAEIKAHLPQQQFTLAGSAFKLIQQETGRTDIAECPFQSAADISAVMELAVQKSNWDKKPKPLYLRKADAKPQLNFAVARTNSPKLTTAGNS